MCLSLSRFQWTSSAGQKELGDRGERGGSAGSRALHSGEERKKVLTAVNESTAPRCVISFVCIVLFVLWRARSSLPCGISVLSHTQPLVTPPSAPTQVRRLPSPTCFCSIQFMATPVGRTRSPSPGRGTAALRELSFHMRSSHEKLPNQKKRVRQCQIFIFMH